MLFREGQGRRLLNAAFPNRVLEQARRERRRHVDLTIERACGLAPDRDVVLVSAERLDVLFHPFHRELLVQNAIVAEEMAFGVERGMGDEADEAHAVIDGDDDDFPFSCEFGAVVGVAGAVDVAAAMNPEDHRQPRRFIEIRREDVEVKTVLVVIWRPGE